MRKQGAMMYENTDFYQETLRLYPIKLVIRRVSSGVRDGTGFDFFPGCNNRLFSEKA